MIFVHIKHFYQTIELDIPNFTTLTLTVHQALVPDHQTLILFINILSQHQMTAILYLFIDQEWRALMFR